MLPLLGFSRTTLALSMIAGAVALSSSPARGHTTLDLPNGGEVLQVGSVYTIQWRIAIAHNLENWDLSYSTTGEGGPWTEIATDLPAGDPTAGSVHTLEWTIPDDPSDQVRVRVQMDNSGTDYEDISDGDFTIESTAVPAVSGWGLIALTLLIGTAGTIGLSRRITPRDVHVVER